MKTLYSASAVVLLTLTGCSTIHETNDTRPGSETVMITYHVRAGKEADFQTLLARAWQVYTSEHLVSAEPHTVVRSTEDGDKTRFIEIFTWLNSPDHAPGSVQAIWKQEEALCETQNGHRGIEGGEVQLVAGR
jgi:hypothetical protein